jgi:ankyrin repeat protein
MMRIVAAVVVVGIVGVVGWFAASRGGGAEAEAPPAPATVLLSASDAGVPSEVDAALAAGAPTSATDAFGRTPLMRAAAAGHDDVVRRL